MSTDWSNPIPSNPLARGEREDQPRTIRFPRELAIYIEALAKNHGQDFTTTTLYLLLNAVEEVKAKSKKKDLKKAS